MENFHIIENSNRETRYKDISYYKASADTTIKNMIARKERLFFAVVAERSEITNLVIREYPELRNYILDRITFHKERALIKEKIDRAVTSLAKLNKSITFISIINRCKFNSSMIYKDEYIKEQILNVLSRRNEINFIAEENSNSS